jgi:hypothetical protein
MRGYEWIHESLEVGAPPLRKGVADLPLVVDAFACELGTDRSEPFVQPGFEALDFVVLGAEVIAGSLDEVSNRERELGPVRDVQLEKCIRDLQHQDMGVVVLMADQDAFTCSPHAMLLIVFLQSLQARKHRRVFLRLAILCSERVVAERVQTNRLWLVCVEVFG